MNGAYRTVVFAAAAFTGIAAACWTALVIAGYPAQARLVATAVAGCGAGFIVIFGMICWMASDD